MDTHTPSSAEQSLETLQDIKRMMERSSRFMSLSGLSGVSAGVCALIGAWFANDLTHKYYASYAQALQFRGERTNRLEEFKNELIVLALVVLFAALASSTFFTWRKARKSKLPMWDATTRKLAYNMAIPLAAGGLFVIGLLHNSDWIYVAPACLIFYGLALVNSSKYTLTDIRYLGILEIIVGCICMYYPHEGLYFWTVGFGALHIIYGLIMWWKYEKR